MARVREKVSQAERAELNNHKMKPRHVQGLERSHCGIYRDRVEDDIGVGGDQKLDHCRS